MLTFYPNLERPIIKKLLSRKSHVHRHNIDYLATHYQTRFILYSFSIFPKKYRYDIRSLNRKKLLVK